MAIQTLAIVIGISKYDSSQIPALKSPVRDAATVASAIEAWGIPRERIKLLAGQDATRTNILEALRIWPLRVTSAEFKLLFYFAGHGKRINEGNQWHSVLMPVDCNPADHFSSSLSVSDLLSAVSRVRPVEAFLFLDACGLRFDRIENPTSEQKGGIPEAELFETPEPGALFCLCAAGPKSAYESSAGGLFTKCLLKSFAKLRKARSTCQDLASEINTQLRDGLVQKPEMYHFGRIDIWPLPSHEEELAPNALGDDLVMRRLVLGQLQDQLFLSKYSAVWLWGEPGAGKTVLVRHFKELSKLSFYFTVPQGFAGGAEELGKKFAAEVALQLPNCFPDGRPSPGLWVNTLLRAQENHGCNLVILDHVDRLNNSHSKQFLRQLLSLRSRFIMVSRFPPLNTIANEFQGMRVWKCPLLDEADHTAFLRHYHRMPEANLASVRLERNPLKLRQLLDVGGKADLGTRRRAERVCNALSASGGYMDQDLFCKAFNLLPQDLIPLHRSGFLAFVDGMYVPHDTLIKKGKSPMGQRETALRYWASEVRRVPQSDHACTSFLRSLTSAKWLESCEVALGLALRSASQRREVADIIKVAKCLPKTQVSPEVRSMLAEQLLSASEFDLCRQILGPPLKARQPPLWAKVLEAERLWWCGHIGESKQMAKRLMSKRTDVRFVLRARLNFGLACFFEGNWKEAVKSFETICQDKRADSRTHGWAKIMLGTCLGYRGVDIVAGRELLASGIYLLKMVGDEVGIASAWNNLGEMEWKSHQLEAAQISLSHSLTIAKAIQHHTIELEATRNMIHVRLRLNGSFSAELDRVLDTATSLLRGPTESIEEMQIWNTLATVALYRADLFEARRCIARAAPLTQDNSEYQIYTSANQGLLAVLEGNYQAGAKALVRAVALCRQTRNDLALQQMENDFDYVIKTNSLTLEKPWATKPSR
jgi:tetratricopeptide (TPR) repeat protein